MSPKITLQDAQAKGVLKRLICNAGTEKKAMLIYPGSLKIKRFDKTPQFERYEFTSGTNRSLRMALYIATVTAASGVVYTQLVLQDGKNRELAAWKVISPWTGAVLVRRVAASLLGTADEYAPTRKDYENIARRIRVGMTKEGGIPRQGLTFDLFGDSIPANPPYSRYGFIRIPRECAEKTDENRRKIREIVNASWVAHREAVGATCIAADSMLEAAYRETYLSVFGQCMFAYSYQTGVIPPEIIESMRANGLYMF